VRAGLEAGARCQWNKATDSSVSLEVGSKYLLDKDATVKAKINNIGILGQFNRLKDNSLSSKIQFYSKKEVERIKIRRP
jgi:hypothetical protein